MTPEEKEEVKLQHAQAKTQRITILTADEKTRRNLQHSRGQENFREPMTPEVKQEVKMRDALAKTQKNGTGNFTTEMTKTGGRCSDKKSKGGTGNSKT